MSSALSGISDLIGSIINSIIAVITSIVDAIQSVLGVGFGAVKDVGGLAGGLIDFVLRKSMAQPYNPCPNGNSSSSIKSGHLCWSRRMLMPIHQRISLSSESSLLAPLASLLISNAGEGRSPGRRLFKGVRVICNEERMESLDGLQVRGTVRLVENLDGRWACKIWSKRRVL